MRKKIITKILKLIFGSISIADYLDELRGDELKKKLKSCGNKIRVRQPLVIESPKFVEIGDNVSLASFVHIWGRGGVRIGDNTMIASHVIITSSNHDHSNEKMHETLLHKEVVIGKGVWIGTHSIILPGVNIGDGAVIGANTLVREDVPAGVIVVGNPGKVIKKRNIS